MILDEKEKVKMFEKIQHKLGVEGLDLRGLREGLGLMPVNRFWGQCLG